MLEHNAGYAIHCSEAYHVRPDGVEEHIVFGKRPEKEQYVTWEALRQPNGNWDYFWGHYFEDGTSARIDYHKRLLSHYKS